MTIISMYIHIGYSQVCWNHPTNQFDAYTKDFNNEEGRNWSFSFDQKSNMATISDFH